MEKRIEDYTNYEKYITILKKYKIPYRTSYLYDKDNNYRKIGRWIEIDCVDLTFYKDDIE